jgi:alkylation response protein AidB-like acyl-CoA dehydrogenase
MTTVTATDPVPLSDDDLAELTAEIRAYVENEGERWAERIEAERAVPDELWPELRDRGYLRLASPMGAAGCRSPSTCRCWSCSRCRTRRCG